MKLTPKEQTTIDYYNEHIQEWVSKHKQEGEFGRLAPEFKLLFKMLPQGKIIEIGTGTGEDAQNLIKKYGADNYVGIEPSEGLRQIATNNNPGAKFINTSIYEIPLSQEKFDGFWLCQMLVHIPKDRINEALESVKSVLKPKSIGMISLLEGSADMQITRGRYYALWTDDEFSDVLKQTGFKTVHKRRLETGASPWLIYIVQKL